MENNLVPQQRQDGGPSIAFLKSPSGFCMIINFIMLFISWCIMAGWRGNVQETVQNKIESETGFYLFATVFPWLLYILFFVILVLGCQNRIQAINWPLTFAINCVIWGFLLFVAACIIASKANGNPCEYWKCDRLKAAAAFGFLTPIGLFLQAFFHHREYRKPSTSAPI